MYNKQELIKDIMNGFYDDFKYSENDTVEEVIQAMENIGLIEYFIENNLY